MMQKQHMLKLNILLYLIVDIPEKKKKKRGQLINPKFLDLYMDNSDLDKKYSCVSNKSELKAEQDRIVKLKAFNLILFRGKRLF